MRPRLTRVKDKESGKYPGYPFYVSSDDVKDKKEQEKELADEFKDMSNSMPEVANDSDTEINPGSRVPSDEYAVTKEDLMALGSKDLSMDGGDDEQLVKRSTPVDFSGGDLDIPGSELDDDSEKVGSEDEENNNYSLGGEDHHELEESKS